MRLLIGRANAEAGCCSFGRHRTSGYRPKLRSEAIGRDLKHLQEAPVHEASEKLGDA
jgi:hypothetical protein